MSLHTQLTSTKYEDATANDNTTNNELAYAECILHLDIQLHTHDVDECEQTWRTESTVCEGGVLNITLSKWNCGNEQQRTGTWSKL